MRARVSANSGESDPSGRPQRIAHGALGGDVVGETFGPRPQRLVRGQRLEQLTGGGAQGIDLMAVGGGDERLAAGEVAVQRADADAGAGGDGFERDVLAFFGEGFGSGAEQFVTIALRIGAQRANGGFERSLGCANGGPSSYTAIESGGSSV